jgi:hypothetical protein
MNQALVADLYLEEWYHCKLTEKEWKKRLEHHKKTKKKDTEIREPSSPSCFQYHIGDGAYSERVPLVLSTLANRNFV